MLETEFYGFGSNDKHEHILGIPCGHQETTFNRPVTLLTSLSSPKMPRTALLAVSRSSTM